MASRDLLLFASMVIVAVSASIVRDSGNVGGLRGRSTSASKVDDQPSSDPQHQSVSGHYFGLHFDDSPAAINPWVTQRSARVVDDLNPTAPFDVLNRNIVWSWTGNAPVPPGKTSADVGYTHPDFVPPYLHPNTFPNEMDEKERDGIMIPIGDRLVVAHEDRLRGAPGIANDVLDPLNMYPLVAPADRISPGPHPVTHLDRIPDKYSKFFDQTAQRDAARLRQNALTAAFKRVDTDDDNSISSTEFDAEVQGRQKKTSAQAEVLWKQYHLSASPDMTEVEFQKMAKTGYDLGQKYVNRSDMSVIIKPPQSTDKGFWGGGAACPEGKYIRGVKIKVKPNADVDDNTALNCVKFKCEGDKEIGTAEGADGAWTEWAECLPGQTVYALSVRVQPYRLGQDNTGINDLMFKCRSDGHADSTTLMFGDKAPTQADQEGYIFVNGEYVAKNTTNVDDKKVVVGKGKVATDGGWSEELTCGTNGALCGAQGRLFNPVGGKDNMGVTDFRFFCCSKHLDCAGPCKDAESTDCKSCKSKTLTVR